MSRRPRNSDRFGKVVTASDTLFTVLENGLGFRSSEHYIYTAANRMWDSDNDGLSNTQENNLGTDPYNADNDVDGLNDGEDPYPLSTDIDEDGVEDRIDNCVETPIGFWSRAQGNRFVVRDSTTGSVTKRLFHTFEWSQADGWSHLGSVDVSIGATAEKVDLRAAVIGGNTVAVVVLLDFSYQLQIYNISAAGLQLQTAWDVSTWPNLASTGDSVGILNKRHLQTVLTNGRVVVQAPGAGSPDKGLDIHVIPQSLPPGC